MSERRSISEGYKPGDRRRVNRSTVEPALRGTPEDIRLSLGWAEQDWLALSDRNRSLLVEMYVFGIAQSVLNQLHIDEEERMRNQPYASHIPQFKELLCQYPDLLVDHFQMRRDQVNPDLSPAKKSDVMDDYRNKYSSEAREPWKPVLIAITKFVR